MASLPTHTTNKSTNPTNDNTNQSTNQNKGLAVARASLLWSCLTCSCVSTFAALCVTSLNTMAQTHHNLHGSDLHKHFHTVSHTLKDELRIIQKTLSEGPSG